MPWAWSGFCGVGKGSAPPFVILNLFQDPWFGKTWSMPHERQPCVYILASKPFGTTYIGVTSDLITRLWQHRTGQTGGFTTRYTVHRLVRFEQFATMDQAITREKQLKNWHRQWKINLIQSENPDWHDLAPGLGLPPLAPRKATDGS
jgi:putative endonuclease